MPRALVIPSDIHPFHVRGRCLNRDWFKVPIEVVWSIMEDYLFLVSNEFNLRIHAFVLMDNHFHLLVSTPNANLSQAMQYFMGQTAREITRQAGRINQTYGCRHAKTLIDSYRYFLTAYKYVYRNPVRAGICMKVEEYPYSTLAGLCGQAPLRIPLINDLILFSPNFDDRALAWLNQKPPSEDDDQAIKRALRHKKFEFKKDGQTRKLPDVANRIY